MSRRQGERPTASSSAVLFVGTGPGTNAIYGYDAKGKLVATIRIPVLHERLGIFSIAFDGAKNMYVMAAGKRSALVKFAPPYTGLPKYVVAVQCPGEIYIGGSMLFLPGCVAGSKAVTYAAYEASDGSSIGSVNVPISTVGNNGAGSGGADSYGNFFTFSSKNSITTLFEYVPPSTLRSIGSSDVVTPVLFTDGATALYVSAHSGLRVYQSAGLGSTPAYKYFIKEDLLRRLGSEGWYATTPNGVLFAAPFQAVPGCAGWFSPWTVSVYRLGSATPFEHITPPKGSPCDGGGPEMLAADARADLFIKNISNQLLYYPIGSTKPRWTMQLSVGVTTIAAVP